MFVLTPAALESIMALALGIAAAGLIASTFEMITEQRASFRLLESGDFRAVASVPLIVFSAPFLILRNTVRGKTIEGRPFFFVMLATIVACFWGMMCGRVMLDLVQKFM
ncbi:MAG: DUF6949 family protein [Beijerinckiaceae bacterium]